jgi:hypothetical protein
MALIGRAGQHVSHQEAAAVTITAPSRRVLVRVQHPAIASAILSIPMITVPVPTVCSNLLQMRAHPRNVANDVE